MDQTPDTSLETVTMCDVLQEEEEMEEDANAVLGGSDDTNCSYVKGYVPRQALYACKTCCKDGEGAGICLACCYKCHDDHEIVELYTKRDFRCDCGNSKFDGKSCQLTPDKDDLNARNTYNQNFRGLYCTCSKPYPDPEDDTPDEMIQCVVCEDWYHGRHLGVKSVPADYFEMICGSCMCSRPFLYEYHDSYNSVVDVESVKAPLDSVKQEPTTNGSEVKVEDKPSAEKTAEDLSPVLKTEPTTNDQVTSTSSETSVKREVESNEHVEGPSNPKGCILKGFKKRDIKKSGAVFWPENWRKDLCGCTSCMKIYDEANCKFLLLMDDTVHAYEERGKGSHKSQYNQGMQALNQLDRVKQMEAVRAYTNMKGQLKKYLQTFADSKRTVQESDIKEFFEQMSKKQRLNNGIPHFCR